jgi:hypothetical protein
MVWKENKTNGASPQLEQRRKGNCVYYNKNLYCFTTDGRITTCFKLDLSKKFKLFFTEIKNLISRYQAEIHSPGKILRAQAYHRH